MDTNENMLKNDIPFPLKGQPRLYENVVVTETQGERWFFVVPSVRPPFNQEISYRSWLSSEEMKAIFEKSSSGRLQLDNSDYFGFKSTMRLIDSNGDEKYQQFFA